MAASVQFRPQNRDLGVVMREVDEDLAIFLGIRNGENERNDNPLVQDPDELDDSKGAEPTPDSLSMQNPTEPGIVSAGANDNFLNLENDKNDYDWLITQPDASLIPSVDTNVQGSATPVQTELSNSEAVSVKSELANTCEESGSVDKGPLLSEKSTKGRPLSSSGDRKPIPKAGAPTERSAKSKGSRASTPTSRSTLPSSRPAPSHSRSSTPTRSTSRSSIPSSRPSIPVISSKPASRSATPTRKSATPTTTPSVITTVRSSSAKKPGPVMKNPGPFHGTSPTVKSRPSKPSDMLSVSHDATQIPKTTSLPKRPVSASRGRPSVPATQLSSKPRQKSCSPARVRAPNTNGGSLAYKNGSKILPRSRGYGNGGDDVNPVLMGTQMVERVVNMRKLAPPKQDEYVSNENVKKSSQENSGFGRSLSKKSLDMAIRHMDIRRSTPEKLRPVATGVKSASAKSSAVGSPLTSSSGSSMSSSCVNSYFLNGNETE